MMNASEAYLDIWKAIKHFPWHNYGLGIVNDEDTSEEWIDGLADAIYYEIGAYIE